MLISNKNLMFCVKLNNTFPFAFNQKQSNTLSFLESGPISHALSRTAMLVCKSNHFETPVRQNGEGMHANNKASHK